jgi:hypothetical protein
MKDFERVIFDSEGYTYDEAKKFLIEDQGIEDPTDDEIYNEIEECNRIAFKDDRFEFATRDKHIEGTVIAVANVGRWNGRKDGIKVLQGFEDVMDFMTRYDEFKIYIDRYNIKGIGHHHDGTDYLTFREVHPRYFRDDIEDIFLSYDGDVDRFVKNCTRSLRKYTKGFLY